MRIVCDLMATEDEKKVLGMLLSIFPDADFSIYSDRIEGESSLERFWQLVDMEGIRPAIQKEMENGHADISKMAAIAGKISLDDSFPLGKVRVFAENGEG